MSLRKKDHQSCEAMGHALGLPDSGLLSRSENVRVIDPNEPLDKLLLDRRFRQSFMEFADRYQLQHLEVWNICWSACTMIYINSYHA